jgi:hypothetical protein
MQPTGPLAPRGIPAVAGTDPATGVRSLPGPLPGGPCPSVPLSLGIRHAVCWTGFRPARTAAALGTLSVACSFFPPRRSPSVLGPGSRAGRGLHRPVGPVGTPAPEGRLAAPRAPG